MIAHNCAGTNANCGLVAVIDPLREMERMGRENRLGDAAVLLADIGREFSRIQSFLQENLKVVVAQAKRERSIILMKIKHSSKRILIADDDPVVRHLITSIVTKLGYTPVALNDGREVLSLLNADADFKAATLDMSMPYLDGLDLIRYMRTEKRLMRIPVLLITAEQSIKLMRDSFAAGATAYLPKPFTPEQLQCLLRMLLAAKMPSTRAA